MNLTNLVPGLGTRFWHLMSQLGRVPDLVEIKPDEAANSASVRIDPSKLPLENMVDLATIINDATRWGGNDLLTLECLGGLAANGPKLFELTEEQAESLEQVDIRMTIGEYSQPYPVMLVRCPPAFVTRLRSEYPESGVPDYLAVRWHREIRMIYILGIHRDRPPSTGDNCMVMVHSDERTIEQSLAKAVDMPVVDARVMARLYRVALNAMLLLMEFGSTTTPSNPEFLEKSRRFYAKRRLESTDFEIRSHVYTVALNQSVVVRAAAVPRDPGDGTHASPHPHWRRGHWARVACGTGRTERRRVFRRPVFVGGSRFSGELSESQVIYRLPPTPQSPEGNP